MKDTQTTQTKVYLKYLLVHLRYKNENNFKSECHCFSVEFLNINKNRIFCQARLSQSRV